MGTIIEFIPAEIPCINLPAIITHKFGYATEHPTPTIPTTSAIIRIVFLYKDLRNKMDKNAPQTPPNNKIPVINAST